MLRWASAVKSNSASLAHGFKEAYSGGGRDIEAFDLAGHGDADQLVTVLSGEAAHAAFFGAEGKGIRRLTAENCDFLVQIPMNGTVECLNVSVATGVCLFEAVRQRLKS